MFRMSLGRFLLFDGGGALLWAGGYALVGLLFRTQLDQILAMLSGMGGWVVALIGGLLGLYILGKYIQRRRFYHKLRVARISPQDLLAMIEAGKDVTVIDLRNSLERGENPLQVKGAIAINFEDLEQRHQEIPRDRDIVLYCT
jgi:membrane protein DedA with SNARE-associated domain